MELKEAVTAFMTARNALSKKTAECIEQVDKLVFRYPDVEHHVHITEVLKPVDVTTKTTIACLNTKENLNILIHNWQDFLIDGLSILFVNPKDQQQWKVMPVAHNKITEKKNLRKGLESLFSQVPEY